MDLAETPSAIRPRPADGQTSIDNGTRQTTRHSEGLERQAIEIQADSRMWATIEGTLRHTPTVRGSANRAVRSKLVTTDASGIEIVVHLVIRARSASFTNMLTFGRGDRVRVAGLMTVTPSPIVGDPPRITLDVGSAVRLGGDRTKHSLFERLTERIKFWSTK